MDQTNFELVEDYDRAVYDAVFTQKIVRARIQLNPTLAQHWLWVFFHAWNPPDGCIWSAVGEVRLFFNENPVGRLPIRYGNIQLFNNVDLPEDHVVTTVGDATDQPAMRYGNKDALAPYAEHYVTVPAFHLPDVQADRAELFESYFRVTSGPTNIIFGLRCLSIR